MMLPPGAFTGGVSSQSVYLKMQNTSGADTAPYVNEAFVNYTPLPFGEIEHAVSRPLLIASAPSRPALGIALLLTLLGTIFLLLRCVYHISKAEKVSTGTSGRRVSDYDSSQPCELPEQEQQQQQGVAGAAPTMPEAAAYPSLGGEAASTQPKPSGYSPPTHLDLISIYSQTATMEALMLQLDDADAKHRENEESGWENIDNLLREGVRILKELRVVTFAGEVGDEERQHLMSTIGQCTHSLERLLSQRHGYWASACQAQTEILNSRLDGASGHLQKVIGRSLIHPDDPEVRTMMGLREAVKSARKVLDDAESIFLDYLQVPALGDALKGLSTAIGIVEETLLRAANACAEAWTHHLQHLRQVPHAEGPEEGEALRTLLSAMDTAKAIQRKLRSISGKPPSE